MAGRSFRFQHDGETSLPNQGDTVFLSSKGRGETSLLKRRTLSTIRMLRIRRNGLGSRFPP